MIARISFNWFRPGLAYRNRTPNAERRVDKVIGEANDAIARARHGAVILAFMIACSLILGMAVAWLAAASGGQHRDGTVNHQFWRRWEVDRTFFNSIEKPQSRPLLEFLVPQ
jgi:hypothetical protein